MAQPNLFQELHDALTQLKTLLTPGAAIVKQAVPALKAVNVPIIELIDKLIDLLGKLENAVKGLKNAAVITGIDTVSKFTQSVTGVLESAKSLLPNEAAAIDDVLAVAKVAASLPSVDQVVDGIADLIEFIIGQLKSIKT